MTTHAMTAWTMRILLAAGKMRELLLQRAKFLNVIAGCTRGKAQ